MYESQIASSITSFAEYHRRKKRTNPYTETGIKQVPCFKCGKSSDQQWQICSLDNEYKGLCQKCDIELNEIVLLFMGIPKHEVNIIIEKYSPKIIEIGYRPPGREHG